MRIPLTVGVHTVIITKDNMTPYTASVFIEEEKEYIIDLVDLAPKVADVSFVIAQESASLFIDGEVIEDISNPLVLNYGEYQVKVTADGYKDWETTLVVNQAYVSQKINLELSPLFIHMTAPTGAEFYIDGILQGIVQEGKAIDAPISTGGHILTLRKSGYISWTQNVMIEDQGQDYYYTVSELTEIQKETESEAEPDADADTTNDATEDEAVTEDADASGN
jgi:hypothetical protein